MNGLVIVLISIVALGAGYLFYGRWLAKKWGLDEKAKTPAYQFEDGEDYVPSSKFTVFAHQFSSAGISSGLIGVSTISSRVIRDSLSMPFKATQFTRYLTSVLDPQSRLPHI